MPDPDAMAAVQELLDSYKGHVAAIGNAWAAYHPEGGPRRALELAIREAELLGADELKAALDALRDDCDDDYGEVAPSKAGTATDGPAEPDRSRWLPVNAREAVFRDWISQQRPELDQARREAELTKLRDYRHTEYKEPSVEARQAYQRLRDAGGGTRALHTEAPGHTPVTLVDPADLALVLDTLEKYL